MYENRTLIPTFLRHLNGEQQFIEINAIGFRKILKKWDKRSKSSTKELYLERQVEVQPCFNRAVRPLLFSRPSVGELPADS
jgi:SPX domain protein involved in polyphosphate accumulation